MSALHHYLAQYCPKVVADYEILPHLASVRVTLIDQTTIPRGVRFVYVSLDDAAMAYLSAVDEAYISLLCARLPPRDGGAFTQDDALTLSGRSASPSRLRGLMAGRRERQRWANKGRQS